MELVGANRNQIGVELMNVFERLLSKPLDRIRVKQHATISAKGSQLCDRLDGANLVVGSHDGDQDRVRLDCAGQIAGRNTSFAVNGEVSNVKALMLSQVFTAMGARHDAPPSK